MNEVDDLCPQVLDIIKASESVFAVAVIPTLFIIGPDGKILIIEIGFEPDVSSPVGKKIREILKK